MKISFSATNPCHLYPMAQAVAALGAAGCYYSGYPQWKLRQHGSGPVCVRTHSLRTNIVYGLLRVPERFRPKGRDLFRWQDDGFDRWVGRHLDPCDFIHAIPGQALHTFRAARKLGIRTVLNHATGPVRAWVRIMEPEYRRVGLKIGDHCPYDAEYFAREDEEYALTDFHCAASSVVKTQLLEAGIPAERIWQIPYGAEEAIFHPGATATSISSSTGSALLSTPPLPLSQSPPLPPPFRIVFAGQFGLRKSSQTLLQALALAARPGWQVDFYGAVHGETEADLATYHQEVPLHFHGPRSQAELAEAFRAGNVLVLPSLEEGFGLVVPQALACGLPCIVSEAVGAKDLIQHRGNGSIFPTRNAAALAAEFSWWADHPRRVAQAFPWSSPAAQLTDASQTALLASPACQH